MEEKDLGITEVRGAKANISDLVVYGDGDTFALLCKASSKEQGWMKSTKVCNVDNGCIVQVTTQQKNPDGSYAVAEALTYVPHTKIDLEAEPRKLVPFWEGEKIKTGLYVNPEPDKYYENERYLGILLQCQQVGHDVHAEINEALKYFKDKVDGV